MPNARPSLAHARRRSRLGVAAVGLLAGVLGLGLFAPAARAQSRSGFDPSQASSGSLNLQTPPELQGLEVVEKLGQKIPLDLEFDAPSGQKVRLADYFGQSHKPVVLAMVYFRCPMQCPLILTRMVRRFNDLDLTIGQQYNVVVVSFDSTEGPDAALKQQLTSFAQYNRDPLPKDLDRSWAFLTGPAETSRTLAAAVGFPYKYLSNSNEYSHPAAIFVLTPDGTVSRYLYGVDFPTDRLRLALLEASDGKIGSSWDRFVLWCFHFDPTRGEYVLTAFRVMQAATVVTTLVVGSFLGLMWLRVERRRRSWSNLGPPAAAGGAGLGPPG